MTGSSSVQAVIGVPLYGTGEHSREALESLLAQTFEDLALVLVDDGGGEREQLADLLADPRVHYAHNERRLGLAVNWRRTFEVGRRLYPEAPYFAWASDHDVWHPHWLERLVAELEREPEAVLAYPRFASIHGQRARPKGRRFESRGLREPARRLAVSYPQVEPGYMVYGLFRAAALERCGIFPAVLVPDRLLLAELSVLGSFVQAPERLWHRRRVGRFSLARQRRSFFPAGAPARAALPWWLVHIGAFAWTVGRLPGVGRRQALELTLVHARACVAWTFDRWRRRTNRARRRAPARLAGATGRALGAVIQRMAGASLLRPRRR
ncbi:MAG: glycosyltransferase family 2 protein [Solirubrobacteraceae bacterium]